MADALDEYINFKALKDEIQVELKLREKALREINSLKHVNQGLVNMIEGLQNTNRRLLEVNAEYKSQAIRWSNELNRLRKPLTLPSIQTRDAYDEALECIDVVWHRDDPDVDELVDLACEYEKYHFMQDECLGVDW